MAYKDKLTWDQKDTIEYILKKYLSEEKVESAMADLEMMHWPEDMDDENEKVDYGPEPKDFPNRF